ncbi:hypothetical protein SCLCIDRAFT_1214510 [Scleroderma citrinum Foug A]|uniref:Uncharacterized protein n=1 Tax=Scleroderma citrinum Foug A TaxID=1036808 RepID=A0A0C3E4L5_9AGAM|nr:hypothetical protein SCLCIDRAFT_1214510 [Scleroderma citrinum Foug A]
MVKAYPPRVIDIQRIPSQRASFHRGQSPVHQTNDNVVLISKADDSDGTSHHISVECPPAFEHKDAQLKSSTPRRWQTCRTQRGFEGAWWSKNALWNQECSRPSGAGDVSSDNSLPRPNRYDLEGAWWSKNAWCNRGGDIRSNTKEVSYDDPLLVTNGSSQPSLTRTNDSPEKFTPVTSMRGQYSNQTDEFCYDESAYGFSSRVKGSGDEIAEGENSRTPSGRQPDMNYEDVNNVPACPPVFHSSRSIRRSSITLCSQVTHSEGSLVQPGIGSPRVPFNTPFVTEFALLNIPSSTSCDGGFPKTLPSTPSYMSNRDAKAIDEWLVPYNNVSHVPAFRGRLDRLRNFVKRVLNFSRADIRSRIVPTFWDPSVERCKDRLNCEKSSEI